MSTRPGTPPHWTVYSRSECSLCEELLAELLALLGPDAPGRITVVDVGDDPELERKYGRRVPVLLADGEFVCAYRLDADRARQFLA